MKKLLFAAVAGLALVGPLALTASAQSWRDPDHQQQQTQQPQYQGPQNHDPRGDQNGGRDQRGTDSNGAMNGGHDQRGPDQNGAMNNDGPRHDGRHAWRDDRRDARWDENQHNGYYVGNRWHFGPPPQSRMGHSNVALGYHPWARGQRLGYYNQRYAEVDYRQQHFRRPPRGYHWVRDDRGDFILAAIATGLIAQVILSNN